ncbi:MAG: adenosine deaminase, partial [Janthinobacterium lividum]
SAAFQALPLTVAHAKQLARNSFNAAFLPAHDKQLLLAEVEAFFQIATVQRENLLAQDAAP